MQNTLVNNGFNKFLKDYRKYLNQNTNLLDVNGHCFKINKLNTSTNKKSGVACIVMNINIRRISKNKGSIISWAVGLTDSIVYFIFFLYFGICGYICLDTSYNFLALSLLLKYSLFFQVPLY